MNLIQTGRFLTFLFCIVCVSCLYPFGSNHNQHQSVLLENVKALTFEQGKYTNARRVSAIPQLQCVGGSAIRSEHLPTIVQCKNQGSDGYDVQWKCTADLNSEVRFGKTEVSCEGYSNPNDPYILQGSCGLEYTLEYTNPNRYNSYGNSYSSPSYSPDYDHSSGSKWTNIIMFAVMAFLIYQIYIKCTETNTNYSNPSSGQSPNNGNPPPTGNNNDNNGFPGYPKTNSYGSGSSYSNQNYGSNYGGNTGGPGFWSGFGGGGLMGYLLGRNTRTGYGGYGSGFGTGYGGFGARPRPSFGGGSFGGSSFGSSSRSSSGFGGTKRR